MVPKANRQLLDTMWLHGVLGSIGEQVRAAEGSGRGALGLPGRAGAAMLVLPGPQAVAAPGELAQCCSAAAGAAAQGTAAAAGPRGCPPCTAPAPRLTTLQPSNLNPLQRPCGRSLTTARRFAASWSTCGPSRTASPSGPRPRLTSPCRCAPKELNSIAWVGGWHGCERMGPRPAAPQGRGRRAPASARRRRCCSTLSLVCSPGRPMPPNPCAAASATHPHPPVCHAARPPAHRRPTWGASSRRCCRSQTRRASGSWRTRTPSATTAAPRSGTPSDVAVPYRSCTAVSSHHQWEQRACSRVAWRCAVTAGARAPLAAVPV